MVAGRNKMAMGTERKERHSKQKDTKELERARAESDCLNDVKKDGHCVFDKNLNVRKL